MKFKSIVCPAPSIGAGPYPKKQVVPNQSMSLREILERFTRGEPLEIGKDASYDEGEDDLEKVAKSDLVDRAEFVEKLKFTQKQYEKEERKRWSDHQKKLDEMAVERLAAAKLAAEKEKGQGPPNPIG